MSLEWRCLYTRQGLSDVHELVDPSDKFSSRGSIVREKRIYHLTVWRAVFRPGQIMEMMEYKATFTSLKKAQAMGIVMASMD